MEKISIRNRKALWKANNIFSDIKPLLILVFLIVAFYTCK